MPNIKFGDLVNYDLRRSHGGNIERAYVIGEPPYSNGGSHLMLADEAAVGMPINADHCALISSGHTEICARLLDRWNARFPDWKLKQTTSS